MRHRAALVLLALAVAPVAAKDLYRCTTPGGTEYRDTPCAPGTGEKAAIANDRPSIADEVAAYRKLDEMKADAKASDARIAAQSKARREAREAEARRQEFEARIAAISAPPPEPSVIYVPVLTPYPVTTHHHRPPPPPALPPPERKK